MLDRLSRLAGQDDVVRRIEAAVTSGRLHHALLFAGPDGVGKYTAARLLTQVLFCTGARSGPTAVCGQCPGCIKLTGPGHSDLHVLEPNEKGRIVVDNIREATGVLHVRPLEAPYKVLIIRDADRMNPQAQNALLKTLEEPPGSARLILTSSRPQTFLVTILSRCQRMDFRPVPTAAIADMLTDRDDGPELSRPEALLIAALSQGSPAQAFDADPEEITSARDQMADLDAHLSPGSASAAARAIRSAAALAADKEHLKANLGLLGVWLRDQILVASAARDVDIANADRRGDIEALAARRGLAQILTRARALETARDELNKPFNYNAVMIVEQMCLAFVGHGRRA